MSQRGILADRIESAMRTGLVSLPGEHLNEPDIDRQFNELNQNFRVLSKQTSGADYDKLQHYTNAPRASENYG